MLEVTQSAVNTLKKMRDQVDAPETHALRLSMGQDGLALVPDETRSDDMAIVHDDDDRPVMVADPQVAARLDGHTLDFDPASSQLILN